MIVKREFVRLGKLFETDKEAEAVFMKAAKEAYDDEHRDSILSTLLRFSLSEREMGWCLTGIGDVIDCFERLDKEKPYDSELSPHQTAEAKVIMNGRSSVVLKLLTRDGETIGITRIHD
ncbi:MAG: hypothetical protein MR637_02995 [Clostridiales bacterium]|nr:hypothetical protein [Clostridiales bacterium]